MSFATRLQRARNMDPEFDDIPSELLQNAAHASRLRRRGAIRSGGRVDLFPSTSYATGRENPDCILLTALRGANDRQGVRYVICGGPEDMSDVESEEEENNMSSTSELYHYRPSPLPSVIDLRPSRAKSVGRAPLRRSLIRPRSGNGCGAVLHNAALNVPRMRSGAALIDPDDDEAMVGTLPEHAYPMPRSKSMCKCTRERVGCLRCGNEVGVRYRPCSMHTFRIDHASVLFDPTHTHLDEPFQDIEHDGHDSDSDSVVSTGSSPRLHSMMNTLGSLIVNQHRQPLRSPPPVPTPLRANLSPMLALSELPLLLGESAGLPATGANATPLSPVGLSLALRRPLRDEVDEPNTPLDGDMGDSDTGRRTPMPVRRVRRKRSESIER